MQNSEEDHQATLKERTDSSISSYLDDSRPHGSKKIRNTFRFTRSSISQFRGFSPFTSFSTDEAPYIQSVHQTTSSAHIVSGIFCFTVNMLQWRWGSGEYQSGSKVFSSPLPGWNVQLMRERRKDGLKKRGFGREERREGKVEGKVMKLF